ncbi:MAG: restriction endonuclease subunit S [Candidatus Treponema excrementipullorum]|nr:restriction endonuclease subunit S [Candidatus Treponema excrementipullorum]
MSNRKTAPSLRFRGFSEPWEEKKLGEICTEIIAGGDVDKEMLEQQGKYPVIANALTNDGIVGFYENEYRVKAPAVTITGRGDVGHAKARKVNFTPVVRLLTIKTNHDVDFMENIINTLKIMVESTGVPQLTVPQVARYELFVPQTVEEEKRIGSYFQTLDRLIALEQQKYDKLNTVKKSMLEKMFPQKGAKVPEIRFKGFSEPWEEKKFEDLANRSSLIGFEDNLPRIEYEDIISGTGQLNKNIFAKKSRKSGILFHKDDVLYGKLRPYLKNWFLASFDGIAVGDFWVLQTKNIDSSFLYRLVQCRQFNDVANQSIGTKMPRADWKLISKTMFFVPTSLSEQTKIGSYFQNLDRLITSQGRKIEKLRNLKKACLEKMFV